MTISRLTGLQIDHYAEVVAIATEMKSFTKATGGSSWAIDRRSS